MSLTNCEVKTDNIQNLADSPTISPSELKKTFDKSCDDMKKYINDVLIPNIEKEVEDGDTNVTKLIKKTYKYDVTLDADIEANTDYTIPANYTVNTSSLDVYFEGCLLNINDHYTERGTGESNTIRFDWKVPSGSKLIFVIRK